MAKQKLKPRSTDENSDRKKDIPVRELKVYYGSHRSNSYARHPVIRLGGNYLRVLCGFKIGDAIEVKLSKGRIEITRVVQE